MKRSRSLSLVLMGSLMFGAQGCSDSNPSEESFTAFTSLSECTQSGLFTSAECREFAASAVEQSPRFSSQQECEKEFGEGQCSPPQAEAAVAAGGNQTAAPTGGNQTAGQQVRPHTGSMWMPMMMGFMAGRFMSGGNYMQGSQPLYKDTKTAGAGRSFRTATGASVAPDAAGRVSNPPSNVKQSMGHAAKPATSRGGAKSTGGFSGGSKFGGSGS